MPHRHRVPSPPSKRLAETALAAALVGLGGQARATEPTVAAETPSPQPSPYSLPFQLRPVAPATVVRADTAYVSDDAGSTLAPTLTVGAKVAGTVGLLARAGLVTFHPEQGEGATAFTNPLLGALGALPLAPDWKLGLFGGVTAPVGSGGGNSPEPAVSRARAAGVAARSAMDNALFAVNDVTVVAGAGLAWVTGGFTAQGELTVLQLTRVRGDRVQRDSSKTNGVGGLHLGYFLIPELSMGAEFRHQRWLSTPSFVSGPNRDTSTLAMGLRGHVAVGSVKLKPALAYVVALDAPLVRANPQIWHLDIPVLF